MVAIVYYFWLYDWGHSFIDVLVRRPSQKPVRCDITESSLSMVALTAEERPFSIKLEDIVDLHIRRIASAGAYVSVNVELQVSAHNVNSDGGDRLVNLFLAPINVYTFASSLEESQALVDVVTAIKSGKGGAIEPNPYLREARPFGSVPTKEAQGLLDPKVQQHKLVMHGSPLVQG